MIKPIPPKSIDFYIEKLKTDELDDYYMVKKIVENISKGMEGHISFLWAQMTMGLIDAGLIYSEIIRDGDHFGFIFLVWSFFHGKFIRANDMEPEDATFSKHMMEYYTNVN